MILVIKISDIFNYTYMNQQAFIFLLDSIIVVEWYFQRLYCSSQKIRDTDSPAAASGL